MTEFRPHAAVLLLGCALGLAVIPCRLCADGQSGGFVRTRGDRLELNGGEFYFSGANSFSLLYSEPEADAQFKVAAGLGINAIRFWGFWNGTDPYGHYVLQSKPRAYPEPAWRRLDYVIYLAHVHNIKLIIPLANQWPEFGGIDTYLEWVGVDLPPKQGGHYERESNAKKLRAAFWQHPEAKAIFFDYIRHMLNRVNVYTGVAYKNDPAIMIWEVMNEPRYGIWEGNPSGEVVRDFIAEVAAFIKSIDGNHLVGTGEEGFLREGDGPLDRTAYPWVAAAGEGVSFALNAEIPEIDVLGCHCWPFQWGLWGASGDDINEDMVGEYPDIAAFCPEWIEAHGAIAETVGKPLYLGEFGLQILRTPGSNLAERDRMMRAVYEAAREKDLSGIAFWHMTGADDPESATYAGPIDRETLLQGQYYDDAMPHDLDFRFDVFCPADKTTCALIRDYSAYTTARVERPDPPFEPGCRAPWAECEGRCVLLDSHPDHCGGCGVVCAPNRRCERGGCRPLGKRPAVRVRSSKTVRNSGGCDQTGGAPPAGELFDGIVRWLLQINS